MSDPTWEVLVTTEAAKDILEIADWTEQQFGIDQAYRYSDLIADAVESLHAGPTTIGARARSDIGPNFYAIHLARPGRHFPLFRVVSLQANELEVIRVLHDSMDIARHLPPES